MYRKLFPDRANTPRGTVYLLHFDRPFGHSRHYIGFTTDLSERLYVHVTGSKSQRNARLIELVNKAGINWQLACVWRNVTLREEFRLKNRGGASRICPICKEIRNDTSREA